MNMQNGNRLSIILSTIAALAVVGCQSGDQADELNGDSVQSATDKVPSKLLRPVVVGEEEAAEIRSPAIAKALNKSAAPAWQHEIRVADATYIAPHFSNFSLPDGAHLIVRSGDGQRSRTYMGQGKLVPGERGFWAMHMPGEVATIELYSDVAVPAGAIVIDRYARGTAAYNDFELPEYGDELGEKAICGADDSEWAKCYESSESAAYNKARAVARLMINGTGACTGWLIGSEGHLMTNEHCIGSASAAANTDYEFMAEGTCGTNCTTWGGCPGVVEADTASLIQLDSALDYALVKLPVNLTGTYGYLQLRPGGGSVGEQIYIPQHPQAWGKRIAMMDGNQVAHIDTLNAAPCSGGPGDVGYNADTQGGSSGSPVLGYSDNLVVALHHCAYCPNRGVPVDPIISDLGNNLPADALGGGGTSPEVCDDGADNDGDGATDCADSDCAGDPACSGGGTWTTLAFTNFESGWGGYTDGGSDARRSSSDSTWAHQGTYCIRIRDNSGSASSFYSSSGFNISSYSELQINFWFQAVSMESGEDFFVEVWDGSQWRIVATYARGTHFNNNTFYNESVTVSSASVNFANDARIRFRADASGNGDKVYIDEVEIRAR